MIQLGGEINETGRDENNGECDDHQLGLLKIVIKLINPWQ